VKTTQMSDLLELAARCIGYANGARYSVRGNFLFQGIPLTGTHVLEVGCGTGAWAIWAALHGAHQVVGIDPEADGSGPGVISTFHETLKKLGLTDRIGIRSCTLQELPLSIPPFDIIVMYNVINHLDEDSVVVLHRDPAAIARYVTLSANLRTRIRPSGWLIVADCMRDNLWYRLGLRSPFAPSIEWHKHQNPRTWIDLFRQAGFQYFDLRWSPVQPLPKLTANRFVQYLTASHFVLRVRVPEDLGSARASDWGDA
jgi:SAM-dependent methyltransferase